MTATLSFIYQCSNYREEWSFLLDDLLHVHTQSLSIKAILPRKRTVMLLWESGKCGVQMGARTAGVAMPQVPPDLCDQVLARARSRVRLPPKGMQVVTGYQAAAIPCFMTLWYAPESLRLYRDPQDRNAPARTLVPNEKDVAGSAEEFATLYDSRRAAAWKNHYTW